MVHGVLMAFIGDVNESRSIDVEGELFGLRAFLCRLVSVTGCGWFRAHGLSRVAFWIQRS